jgi:hypothetical protein
LSAVRETAAPSVDDLAGMQVTGLARGAGGV